MGGAHSSFRLGRRVVPAVAALVGWTLVDIQHAFLRFDKLSRLPGVEYAIFGKVFPVKNNAEAFAAFDSGKGRVDILEVFAAMSLASDASPNERKKFAFQFFDFDGSKAITVDELVIMLRSTLVGLAKLTGGICPSVSECEELADQVMETADSIVKDSMITYVEFSQWVRETPEPRALLSCFTRQGELKLTSSKPAKKQSSASVKSTATNGKRAGARQKSTIRIEDSRSRQFVRDQVLKHAHRVAGTGGGAGAGAGAQAGSAASKRAKGAAPVKWSKAEVLTLKKLFDTMDVDLSGSVDITEFSRNLHDRLVSHMRGMFDILDRNHDGRISFDELLREMYPYAKDKDIAMMVEWTAPRDRAELVRHPSIRLTSDQVAEMRALFDMYDLNRSGVVDMDELFQAMSKAGVFTADEIRATFRAADVDRSSNLTFEEFKQFYKDVFGAQGGRFRRPGGDASSASTAASGAGGSAGYSYRARGGSSSSKAGSARGTKAATTSRTSRG